MTANRYSPFDLAVRLESWAQKVSAEMRQALGELSTIRRDLAGVGQIGPMPGPMEHIGEIVRWLREGAGLSRLELAQATALADATIRNVESGRHVPTTATLRKLLRAPCMFTLPELATSEGLSLRLAADRKRRPALQRRRGKGVKQ